MPNIPFTVSARTARLIGRENVANAEGALIELVKNCYDADAPDAIVLIDKPNDTIFIIDNGDGMTDKIIREEWMTIGTDEKLNTPITYGGRIKAGAKGIGRFALDRLGEKCTLITFPIHNTVGYRWEVNWNAFEQRSGKRNKYINEVFASLNPVHRSNYKKEILKEIKNDRVFKMISIGRFSKGTMLKITGLRDKWEDYTIENIYQNLELLSPPDGARQIKIWFFNSNEPEKYGQVNNQEFNDFDYKIVADYKKNSNQKVSLTMYRNEFDLSLIDKRLFTLPDMKVFPFDRKTFKAEQYKITKSFSELIPGFKDVKGYGNQVGNFRFTFYFLKNQFSNKDRDKFKYKELRGDRSDWIKKFGGIKLYRDNFRIRPYGEANTQAYDWLMLGERHNQNPAAASRKGGFTVGANQVAGIVNFSRLTNPMLEDKSSREGLQENEVFELFRNLLKGIIKVQEDDRSTIFSNLLELYSIINAEEQQLQESQDIASDNSENEEEQPEVTRAKNKTLKVGIRVQEQQLKDKEEELSISRAMASAGIMIASFSHEFHGIRNELSSTITEVKKYLLPIIDKVKLSRVEKRKNPILLLDNVDTLHQKMRQWVEFTLGLTTKDRRTNKDISLVQYFLDFKKQWQRLLDERDIKFNCICNENPNSVKIKISYLDLDTIFDNLLTNSIEALQNEDFKGVKKITVTLKRIDDHVSIDYKDSGPGLLKTYKEPSKIFEPFESSKTDDKGNKIGTGLGMWLVKSSIDANKGEVEIRRPASGFQTIIKLKGKKI